MLARDDAFSDSSSSSGFAPVDFFFRQEHACYNTSKELTKKTITKKHTLPDLCTFLGEEPFAAVSMGWNETGLFWHVVCDTEALQVSYPDIELGDSIELFIDTRNARQARTTHRYCHHFFFLPESVDGHNKGEITRFRTEDSHALCDSSALDCTIEKKQKQYEASIFIPASCLVGYNPEVSSRLGFCYRINRHQNTPQHFGISSKHVRLEHVPYLWSTLLLT
jgi:hypothetical protein